jgi:hypothetical protein
VTAKGNTVSFRLRPPKREAQADAPRVSRTAELLALALHFEGMLARGEVKSFGELARLADVSTARISQVMRLLNLSPADQERLLTSAPS